MTSRCPHCHAPTSSPPRSLRVIVVALAWTVTLAMVFAGSLIGPFVIGILPVLFLGGLSVVVLAQRYAYGDRICHACDRAFELDGVPVEPVRSNIKPEPSLEHSPSLAA